jgi:Zn-finger nucleic acid-binding protein
MGETSESNINENKPIDQCPKCGSIDVNAGDTDQVAEKVLIVNVHCFECDFKGTEEWHFHKSFEI